MNLSEAIKKRILELVDERKTSTTNLCLNSNITPSTVFDFLSGKSKNPSIATIKKLCNGANISLSEFFSKEYFDTNDD